MIRSTPGLRRYVLDTSVRRSGDGRVLIGGEPARVVRLTAVGSAMLNAAMLGRLPDSGAGRELILRLEWQGLIHPQVAAVPRADPVTTIIPVRNGASGLKELVAALRSAGEVIVVDDGSTDATADIARQAGARVLANTGASGPSAARNTGLEAAGTPLVTFVDADCIVAPGWHDALVAHFEDPRLAIAAPRVAGLPGCSSIARYEQLFSPLDLGHQPALVGPQRRLPYVPSAALVARRSALISVGGFDPSLQVGEDVDLVWRCAAAGWSVRYDPQASVFHKPRPSLRGFARQRYSYGTSAPLLEARHPGAAAPLHISPHTLAIWAAGTLFGPGGAAGGLAVATLAAVRASAPSQRSRIARVVARGHVNATRHLARVISREWLPLVAVGAACSRRMRLLAALAFSLDLAASARGRLKARDLFVQSALRAVDQASYTAGLWHAARQTRSIRALRVRVANQRRAGTPGSVARVESRRQPGVSF